ncbi:MLP-like protein 43 [Manihot esculenta]|uniref:Bet v I/Major latex protein domain-containing protein n=1 Tax=Manihot esculenta TaxID=3983 RepID=A0A2C9U5P2_MANES|nr:MLP-like protein 43 [Manihot esculenta]OAY25251.1 hypothetical protein MANES_17G079000v8 [Manihot esculenta]
MTLVGKLEGVVEIDAPAVEFHDVFSCRPHHVPNMTPDRIHGCDLHEGEWGKEGTIVLWNYSHDGSRKVAKELIENIDDVNLSTTYKVIEGDILKEYKSIKGTVQATPKEKGSLVRWTLEYEKLNENIPDPHTLLEFLIHCSKDISAHLMECQKK